MPPVSVRTVLLTRPERSQEPLRTLFRDAGLDVLSQPTIEIRPPQSWEPVDDVLHRLDAFDWIVFASANGVEFFLDRYQTVHFAGFPKICAIGPGTAAALIDRNFPVKIVPDPHTAEGVVAALRCEAQRGKKILLVRASRGRDVMLRELAAAHSHEHGVEEIVVYESVDVETPDPKIVTLMESRRIDWTTCTSSAIATSLVRMFGESLRHTKLASLSPITSDTIRKLGFLVAVESKDATMPGLFHAVLRSMK